MPCSPTHSVLCPASPARSKIGGVGTIVGIGATPVVEVEVGWRIFFVDVGVGNNNEEVLKANSAKTGSIMMAVWEIGYVLEMKSLGLSVSS
jgi:hypothetical protein